MRTTTDYRYFRNLISLLIPLFFLASCGNNNGIKTASFFTSDKFDEDDFVATLSTSFTASTDSNSKDSSARLSALYKANGYFPVWLAEDGNTELVSRLIDDLDSLRWDGLNPQQYDIAGLREQLKAFKDANTPDMGAVIRLDTSLTSQYVRAARHLLFGMVKPKEVDSLWYHANDSTFNVSHIVGLSKEGKYPSLDSFRSRIAAYKSLQKALRHFDGLTKDVEFTRAKAAITDAKIIDSNAILVMQREPMSLPNASYDTLSASGNMLAAYQQYYGLKPTGKVDSLVQKCLRRQPAEIVSILRANMERIRWLPRSLEDTFVIVNVPQMELDLMQSGRSVMHMNVVVGKPARQTPSLGAPMANVVINPSWGVPPTILKQDVLPGMARSGSAYLSKKGLRVYTHSGIPVDASEVNSSNYKNYTFKQAPGDDNALGNIKFNLPNKWDIYLHDTPHREDFVKNYRALSSGCVRVQQPRELAEYILSDLNGKSFDQYKLDSVIGTQKTRWEVLKNKLPVHIVYLTAFDGGTGNGVRFARDIYGRDPKLMEVLGQ